MGAGAATGVLLRRSQPLGTVAGDTPVTRAVLAEETPVTGNPQGSLPIVLFTDFNCGACRTSHPELMQAVRDDGDVAVHHMDWPIFGEDSKAAARIALASQQLDLYAQVHDSLMQGGRADASRAKQAVAQAGGDVGQLDHILHIQSAVLDGKLARFSFHAFSLGLRGTPSLLSETVLFEGAANVRDYRRLFDRARNID